MSQVVTTKFIGPTNRRLARIQVKSWLKTQSFVWDNRIGVLENHSNAVAEFIAGVNRERPTGDYQWHIEACGGMPDGSGYGFVITLA